jgi:hypothetical protein
MRNILLSLALVSLSSASLAQPPVSTQQRMAQRPAQQVDSAVLAVSASTWGNRFLFWITVPGAPPEGRAFRIRPDRESPWGGSGVMALLMASYQTRVPVRIFYIASSEPEGVGEITRVDTIRPVR